LRLRCLPWWSEAFPGTAFLSASCGYAYSGLAAGTYFARTDDTGYLDELWNNINCAQDACTVITGTPISLSAGATANVSVQLSGSDTIFASGFQ
jgi:hypothetical protein